jgi:hypothetical protein
MFPTIVFNRRAPKRFCPAMALMRKPLLFTSANSADHGRKGSVDVAMGAGGDDLDLPPDDGSCRCHVLGHGLGSNQVVRIDEQTKPLGSRPQLMQQPQDM